MSKVVYDELLKRDENKTVCEEAAYVRNLRYDLMSQMGAIRARQNDLNARMGELLSTLRQDQKDLDGIPAN